MAKDKKVHINIVSRFVPLKQLEIGMCLAEVYDAELAQTWDDTIVGGDLKKELLKLRNICTKCVRAIPEQTDGHKYVIAFRSNPNKSKLELEPCEEL